MQMGSEVPNAEEARASDKVTRLNQSVASWIWHGYQIPYILHCVLKHHLTFFYPCWSVGCYIQRHLQEVRSGQREEVDEEKEIGRINNLKDSYLPAENNIERIASESSHGESFDSGYYEIFHGENDEENDEMDIKVKRTVSVSPHYHS